MSSRNLRKRGRVLNAAEACAKTAQKGFQEVKPVLRYSFFNTQYSKIYYF